MNVEVCYLVIFVFLVLGFGLGCNIGKVNIFEWINN